MSDLQVLTDAELDMVGGGLLPKGFTTTVGYLPATAFFRPIFMEKESAISQILLSLKQIVRTMSQNERE
jgi:hypothetical protein